MPIIKLIKSGTVVVILDKTPTKSVKRALSFWETSSITHDETPFW